MAYHICGRGRTEPILCIITLVRTKSNGRIWWKQNTYVLTTIERGVTAFCLYHCVNRKWSFFPVQTQIRQQEEVEKKAEVAMEMSDLVVYCQPRSKEKDRFGKDMQMPTAP